MSRKDFNSKYEPLLYGWKKGFKHKYYGNNSEIDVWEIDRIRINDLHPTMKPVALCQKAISLNSRINKIVADFFGGSGSTLIACEKLKRKCYMMEIDPKYCDVIIKKYKNYTSKKTKAIINVNSRT